MDPNQPYQPQQPQQPAPPTPPLPAPEQPQVAPGVPQMQFQQPQPQYQPQVEPQQQTPAPMPVQPQQMAQQPAFGTPAQPGTPNSSEEGYKIIRNASRSLLALGIFYTVLFTLTGIIGAVVMVAGTSQEAEQGVITLLASVFNVIVGVIMIVMATRIKKQQEFVKAGAMMRSVAIGLSVLGVLSLIGQGWLGAALLIATAGVLFMGASKLSKVQ